MEFYILRSVTINTIAFSENVQIVSCISEFDMVISEEIESTLSTVLEEYDELIILIGMI